MGVPGQKPQNKRTKFLNLLVLVHLKNYFIEALNTFFMCFKINRLKNLKLTILRFFAWSPIYTYYSTAVKAFFLLKHQEFIQFLYLRSKIYFSKKQFI